MTIKQKDTNEEFQIVSEMLQEDGSIMVGLAPIEGLQSHVMGFVNGTEEYQAMSDKYWNREELEACYEEYKRGEV